MRRPPIDDDACAILPPYPGFRIILSHHIYQCKKCDAIGTKKFAPLHAPKCYGTF